MFWKVELLDVFEHSWHVVATCPTRKKAIAVARAKFATLQPPPAKPDLSSGPHPPGIQDRLFIIPSEGEGAGWQYLGEWAARAPAGQGVRRQEAPIAVRAAGPILIR